MTGIGLAYGGRRAALLTRHRKGETIAAALGPATGVGIVETADYDTDLLGTFDGRVPRRENQLATARRKAQLGMELTGLPLGLGSEGSFGPDPWLGFAPWNIEVVLWLDPGRRLEVAGWAQGAAKSVAGEAADTDSLTALAESGGFPDHHLILRPVEGDPGLVFKGLADLAALREAFEACKRASPKGLARVESDFRAHCNPTRRKVIREAAEALARRLATPCPACGCPGFGALRRVPGLPCESCGEPTSVTRSEVLGCPACGHEQEQLVAAGGWASAADCEHCNP